MSTEHDVKRSIVQRRRPGPQPPPPTHEELFREAFMHALQGCCSQFETTTHFVNRKELGRARQLVRRAWNVAVYSTNMFEDTIRCASDEEAEIDQFNAAIKGKRR